MIQAVWMNLGWGAFWCVAVLRKHVVLGVDPLREAAASPPSIESEATLLDVRVLQSWSSLVFDLHEASFLVVRSRNGSTSGPNPSSLVSSSVGTPRLSLADILIVHTMCLILETCSWGEMAVKDCTGDYHSGVNRGHCAKFATRFRAPLRIHPTIGRYILAYQRHRGISWLATLQHPRECNVCQERFRLLHIRS